MAYFLLVAGVHIDYVMVFLELYCTV